MVISTTSQSVAWAEMSVRFDWNDARILLALARTGSSAAAAVELGVSGPTIGRRLRVLSASAGEPLAVRGPTGLALTPTARRLVQAAERMEVAAADLSRAMTASESQTVGDQVPVRVTATPMITDYLLRNLGDTFASSDFPPVTLIATSQILGLARGEADIAIRMGRLPRAQGFRCRRLGEVAHALYRRRDTPPINALIGDFPMAATHAMAASVQSDWIDLESTCNGLPVKLRVTDPMLRLVCCKLGLGTALLPCFQGDSAPDLIRVGPPVDDLIEAVFLISHPDTINQRRVRVVADAVASAFDHSRNALHGATMQ